MSLNSDEKRKIYEKSYKKDYCKKNSKWIVEKKRIWRLKNPEKFRKQMNRYIKNYKKRNKIKVNARNMAEKYIKIPEGTLCQKCGKNIAKERHHEDYTKPLEVKFWCKDCHFEHRKMKI
jgi:hypothetical protein